jgi:prepilin-type N-terminal cleavage/methylation domain-containing protein/prepilin-type processing-associated H-X9-DG protein
MVGGEIELRDRGVRLCRSGKEDRAVAKYFAVIRGERVRAEDKGKSMHREFSIRVRSNQASTGNRGFTLIEIMVTVVIMAVLMAILVPTMRRARETALLASCAANAKTFGQSTHTNMVDVYTYPSNNDLVSYTAETMLCPSDSDPLMLPPNLFGNLETLVLSYGLNLEFNQNNLTTATVKSPSGKALYFDGGRSTSDIQVAGGPGYTNDKTGSANKGKDGKASVIHKPGTNAESTLSVANPALGGHLGHGDFLGALPPGIAPSALNLAALNKNDFNPRHALSSYLGNVLFVDGHVNAYKQLDNSMMLFP